MTKTNIDTKRSRISLFCVIMKAKARLPHNLKRKPEVEAYIRMKKKKHEDALRYKDKKIDAWRRRFYTMSCARPEFRQ